MNRWWLLLLAVCAAKARGGDATFCNPLNLNYKLQADPAWTGTAPYREAADPSIVIYRNQYWLFASVSGGYWHSKNLAQWDFVATTAAQLPGSDTSFAPTAVVLDGTLYVLFRNELVYGTKSPLDAGSWRAVPNSRVGDDPLRPDPQFFYDEDTDRLWLTSGCSPTGSINVEELDRRTFAPKGAGKRFMLEDHRDRGWERAGNHNEKERPGWTEGSQMLKHGGKYYLIYSLPALDNSYANGVYVGDSPLGPFTFAPYSPFAQKMTGFIGGAGHGQVFEDKCGNWWNATCEDVYVLHPFERRLGLYPTFFTPSGQLATDTIFGDYPLKAPQARWPAGGRAAATGWMLLSRGRPATASSSLPGHPPGLAVDENVRTWWSAASNRAGEWLQIDLGACCRINAIQANFAEQNLLPANSSTEVGAQYRIELSPDGSHWLTAVDRTRSRADAPHDYAAFAAPEWARYVRIVNGKMPWNGLFAVRDLRVFGLGPESPPSPVADFTVSRDPADSRNASLNWQPAPGAGGYMVRYGNAPDRLYLADATSEPRLALRSLNRGVTYYFRVDAYNRGGCRAGAGVKSAPDPVTVADRVVTGEPFPSP